MTDSSGPQSSSRFEGAFFLICFLLVGFILYLVFRPFFSIFVWACVLAVIFQPLLRVLLRIVRGQRAVASLVACLVILHLIVLPVSFVGIMVSQQSLVFYHNIQDSINSGGGELSAKIQDLKNNPGAHWVLSQLATWLGSETADLQGIGAPIMNALRRFLVSKGPSFLVGVGGMFYEFIIMFVTMFFLFRDGPKIMQFVRSSNPLPSRYESEIIQKFQDMSYATFFGSLLTALVQGCAGALLFWALGMGTPLFWGALISLVALAPIVGAFLVWIPVSAYLMLMGHMTKGIILLAVGGLVVSSIDNVLKPIIIQGRTDLHPLLVFLSVLGGMQAFGFLGILLGPLAVAIFVTLLNFYRQQFGKNLESPIVPDT
jgi:predicted PurR-regulated permease PerM